MKKDKSALLIIDMQKNVVAHAYRRDEVIANIQNLIKRARLDQVPVIWVQHSSQEMKVNSEGWQVISELQRQEEEVLIHKVHGDSFEATSLSAELDKMEIGRLIVVGAQTDACIRSTIHGAFVRGYDTILVSDAHTTEDLTDYGLPTPEQIISFTNIYWTWQSAPGRQALVVKTVDVKWRQ